ncbi:hypothetical protein J4225_01885 [Candidatus Pacearchaeota archaeon]|nr:hypothetical protein [Candidatus Pacearchaeota archaeon]
MKIKLNKIETNEYISEFFKNIKTKTSKEIKGVKRLAMRYNIKLGKKRKLFCKKCFSPRLKVLSIKSKIKRVKCGECGDVGRWKVK